VKDPWVLARAADLGHAMQLTNILRDVGEDLGRGRLYLPLDRMAAHGLTPADLEAAGGWGGSPPAAYRALMEELMEFAECRYQRAFQAIPALPRYFQRPVLVAALAYRGIHTALRRNGYDNIGRRAYTTPADKLRIAVKACWMPSSLRELFPARPHAAKLPRAGLGLAAAIAGGGGVR
jgi:phytoene synthase